MSLLSAGVWVVSEVVKVVDGDTAHVHMRTEPQLVTADLAQVWVTAKPWKCRVVIVDTPERGEVGYLAATEFTRTWFAINIGGVMAETLYRDSFGRMLTDFYVKGDRGNTLTQALLQAGYAIYKP